MKTQKVLPRSVEDIGEQLARVFPVVKLTGFDDLLAQLDVLDDTLRSKKVPLDKSSA
ncbi:hypothetical protein [Sphingomonas sp. TZW2008]|uniref:hypothetical protein n=1 Tax=Sphingomonas sp. TZW2008 TaxID=1917973 RepID=UPI0015C5162F|nr:hypothetical protein [Sphingomonas sp. TZW2008]